MRRVVDCDHLIDGGNLFLDGLDPEDKLVDFAKQLGAFPFQFPSMLTLPRSRNEAGDYPIG